VATAFTALLALPSSSFFWADRTVDEVDRFPVKVAFAERVFKVVVVVVVVARIVNVAFIVVVVIIMSSSQRWSSYFAVSPLLEEVLLFTTAIQTTNLFFFFFSSTQKKIFQFFDLEKEGLFSRFSLANNTI
tara:strand:- start:131 stop:523 length:393 start_codon:yes stop_codon:yes gene_type:complete